MWYWCWLADDEGKGIEVIGAPRNHRKLVAINFAHVSQIVDQTPGDPDGFALLVFANGDRMLVKNDAVEIADRLGAEIIPIFDPKA